MFHYAATTAGCMFLFNILDTQSVALVLTPITLALSRLILMRASGLLNFFFKKLAIKGMFKRPTILIKKKHAACRRGSIMKHLKEFVKSVPAQNVVITLTLKYFSLIRSQPKQIVDPVKDYMKSLVLKYRTGRSGKLRIINLSVMQIGRAHV